MTVRFNGISTLEYKDLAYTRYIWQLPNKPIMSTFFVHGLHLVAADCVNKIILFDRNIYL